MYSKVRKLIKAGFELIDEGFRTTWVPDEAVTEKLREYGAGLIAKI